MRRWIRKDDGSITLEAAMVLPFFMIFIMFLATLIRISVADMALYKAAAETNEVIVAFAYPVDLATTAAEEFAKDKVQSILPDEVSTDDLINWTNEALLFFGVDVAASAESLFEDLAASAVLPILQDKFEIAAGDAFFDTSYLNVDNIELPSLAAGTGEYLQIEVSYEIPISIPFINESIILSKTASERIWTGS